MRRLTDLEKSFARRALGGRPRRWEDVRICEARLVGLRRWVGCNRIVIGHECDKCGRRTCEFRLKYLLRFPRKQPAPPAIPENVVNREYKYPTAFFVQGGLPDTNRRH